jgi:predicted flap endonuclease-1-like 5' DNA nuclease
MGGLKDHMARLGEEIASGRADRMEILQSLKDHVAELKKDVGEMLTDFSEKRAEARHHMQSELREFTMHLRHFADELGEQVVNMRKGFHQERTDMIDKMNENLGGFMTALKSGITQWRSDRPKGCNGGKIKDSVVREAKRTKRHAEAAGIRDDLTQIKGIGAKRQELLNKAGIHTFAQLAQSTSEQLMRILGVHSGPVKVEMWISDARAMIKDSL